MWILLFACSQAPHAITSTELRVFAFPGYMPADVVAAFEAETGVKVTVDTYDTNEQLVKALASRPGSYDVIVPSDYTVERLIRAEALEPLDLGDLPNYNNIDPSFLSPYFDPGGVGAHRPGVNHEKYSLPWLWGTFGIAYDASKVSPPPTSWTDLWRPDLAGHLAVVDDPREMLGVGLVTLGYEKNDAKPEHLDAARDKLKTLAPGIVAYDANTIERYLIDGSATVAATFSGNAVLAQRQNPNITYVLPSDGAGIWFDNLAIPKGAAHKDAAVAFIDFLMRPEHVVALLKTQPYSNPNHAGMELLKTQDPEAWDAYRKDPATSPSPGDLAGARIVKDVGPEASERFEAAWSAVKGVR